MWAIGAVVLSIAAILILLVLVVVVAKKCGKKKREVHHGGDNLWVTLPDSPETKSETNVGPPSEKKTTEV